MMEIRRLVLSNSNLLPSSYQRLEYIRNAGYAFLRPGYEPVSGDEIDMEFTLDERPSDYACIFSAGTSTYQFIALQGSGGTTYCRYFSSGSAVSLSSNFSRNTWYRMTVTSSGVFATNGASVTSTPNGEINGTEKRLWIFRRANSNYPFKGKLKSFKLSNNGLMKLNLIPCKQISNGKIGVYDTVSKQFYSSSSSTEEFLDT